MAGRSNGTSLEFNVGALTLLALGFFAWMILFVDDLDPFGGTYRLYADFDEIQLLQKGDPIRKNGLIVGKVEGFEFQGNRIRVLFHMQRPYRIRRDAKVAVGNVGLFGANYVKVSEPALARGATDPGHYEPEDVIEGEIAPDFETLLRDGTALVGDLRTSVQAVHAIVGDTRFRENILKATDELRDATASGRRSLEKVEESVRKLMDDAEGGMRSARKLLEGKDGFDGAMKKLTSLIGEVDSIAKENRGRIRETVDAVRSVVEDIRDRALARHLSDAAKHLDELAVELGSFARDLNNNGETPERIRRITERVEVITRDLADMTGDTKEAVQASHLEGKLRRAFDDVHTIASRVDELGKTLGDMRSEVVASLFYSDAAEDFRPDLNASFHLGGMGFVRVGVEDIGGRDDLNLQIGRDLTGSDTVRVGIIADEFGIGYDRYLFRKALQIRLEAYRPDDLLFRYAARIRFRDDTFLSLRLQEEAILKERVAYVGVERRF